MKLLKRVAQQFLSLTPYAVVKRTKLSLLPEATFENVRLALAYYLAAKEMPVFVQIGACDGITGDSVHEFVLKGKMRAVLLEPIEESFNKLKTAFEGVANVSLIRAAVGPFDGQMKLFKVKGGQSRRVSSDWTPQLASFDRSHLLRHGIQADEIDEVIVPALTLKTLLHTCGLDMITILQVDTEGFDAQIVESALELPHLPECINFENIHLRENALQRLFKDLHEHHYVWTHDKWNTLALHKTVLESWS